MTLTLIYTSDLDEAETSEHVDPPTRRTVWPRFSSIGCSPKRAMQSSWSPLTLEGRKMTRNYLRQKNKKWKKINFPMTPTSSSLVTSDTCRCHDIIWQVMIYYQLDSLKQIFVEILIKIQLKTPGPFNKKHWTTSSVKWRQFCLDLNVLKHDNQK